MAFLLAEDEGFDKIVELLRSSPQQATVHWTVAYKWFESLSKFSANKKGHPFGWPFHWQRMRDSNPRKRSQSPVCYRYTNPLGGDNRTRTCDLMRVKHAL